MIRPLAANDIAAGLHLSRLSNWNQLQDDWRYFVDLPGSGGYVFEESGTVVGTVAWLRYGPFCWLSMMLVDPAVRRSGIGSKLMEAALRELASEPCVRLDATPAGEPLYRRFGFVAEYALCRGAGDPGRRLSGGVRPLQPEHLPAVFALDREAFGADRSAILASLYRRAPDLAWITANGASYSFGRPGRRYRQIGPIVAGSPAAAHELVAACLTGEPTAVDVPVEMSEWKLWLESVGFVMERPFLRMRRGENPSPGVPARQLAIAGPELG